MQEGEEYYYFLATDIENGVVEYTQTLEEFNALKEQWQPVWDALDAETSANSEGGQ